MPNSATATSRPQTYSSEAWPKGCPASAGRSARRMPTSSSTWLAVSTSEWMPSASIADEPVTNAAANLVTAMARLAANAP